MTEVHRPGDGKAGTALGSKGGRQRRGGKGIYSGAIPAARAFLEDMVVLQTLLPLPFFLETASHSYCSV